jgi:hypothetical protein
MSRDPHVQQRFLVSDTENAKARMCLAPLAVGAKNVWLGYQILKIYL